MHYSLLSRFQGALLGAALGEQLASGCSSQSQEKLTSSENFTGSVVAQCRNWQAAVRLTPHGSSPWGEAAVSLTKQLLHSDLQGIEFRPWGAQLQGAITRDSLGENFPEAAVAIAALPLALFCHDDGVKLRRVLQQAHQAYPEALKEIDGTLAVGYAIAQALKERLTPDQLLSDIISYLHQTLPPSTPTTSNFTNALKRVQSLLQHRADLHRVAVELLKPSQKSGGTELIALAFYCFLSTPNDFPLSIARAARIRDMPAIVCALTGALSGAYNSTAGIPTGLSLDSVVVQPLNWGLSSLAVAALVARLFARWSGAYDSDTFANSTAIAAPNVIRPV